MDGKNGLILWILGGTGVLFLYSAYKAKSPQEVLLTHLGAASKTPVVKPSSGNAGPAILPSVQLTPLAPAPAVGGLTYV